MISAHLDSEEVKDPALAELGNERLEALKLYLMKNGINYTRIKTEDREDTAPADNSGTDLARAKNRRVSFTFIP
jgi:outer membrane protein OmpA-like peptidoglycan-associated protein